MILEKHFDDVEEYLTKVKAAIRSDRYRIDRNSRRQDNVELFQNYILSESSSKDILLSLTAYDFVKAVPNEHVGFEHEILYIFGKDVTLLQRFGNQEEVVSLYIKFNQLENQYVIVISFHKQKFALSYPFK